MIWQPEVRYIRYEIKTEKYQPSVKALWYKSTNWIETLTQALSESQCHIGMPMLFQSSFSPEDLSWWLLQDFPQKRSVVVSKPATFGPLTVTPSENGKNGWTFYQRKSLLVVRITIAKPLILISKKEAFSDCTTNRQKIATTNSLFFGWTLF
jgi:hypothetical protein